MKATHKILLLVMVAALFALACGLGGAVTDKVDEAKDAVAAEAEKAIEEAAEQLEDAAAEAQNAAEGAAEEVQEAAGDAAAEVQEVAEEGAAEVAEAVEEAVEGEAEEVTVEFSSIDEALANLSSYKNLIKMTFSGTDADGSSGEGSVELYAEYTKEPTASYIKMIMSGEAFDDPEMPQMGEMEMEIYQVGGVTYMKNPMFGEEGPSWMSFAGDEDDLAASFLSSDDMLEIPDTARRSLLPQDVNNISCWHYSFDEKDLTQPGTSAGIESAKGEMWVARDGGYPVKIIIEGVGISSGDPSEAYMDGNFKMEYELMSINEKFEIVVPEEALNAGGAFFGGDSGGESDLPMLDDAVVDFAMDGMLSYATSKSIEEVVAFYKSELPAQGWEIDTSFEMVDESSALVSFKRDGVDLTLSATKENDKVMVALFTSE